MAASRPESGNKGRPNSPSIWLPLRYLLAGQMALLLAVGWSLLYPGDLADYYYQAHNLAFTHLVTLGWITMTIMGASYQLVPVALEVDLYSERLGRLQFWLMIIGIAGMVGHFWIGQYLGMALSASLLLIGVALYLANMARTLLRVPRWNIVAAHVAAALGYFAATVVLGNLMAWDKVLDYLGGSVLVTVQAHAHLAAIGWVTMMIFGVSYKLIPMFTLAEVRDGRLPWIGFGLLNAGLVGLFAAILARSPWLPLFGAMILAAIGLFGLTIRRVLRARRRPQVDWGVRHALTALAYLGLAAALGMALGTGFLGEGEWQTRLISAYALLGLFGWITLTIVGMTYKILPFLVWLHRYSDLVGLEPVPPATALVATRPQRWGYWFLNLGIIGEAIGMSLGSPDLVRGFGLALAAGVGLFGATIAGVYVHLLPERLRRSLRRKKAGAAEAGV